MTYHVEPIAFVSATRKTPEDDFWGGEVAEIRLADFIDASALAGLIFAQRGKNRPNRIGSTICKVVGVEGTVLRVSELDAIDGTPVLDIKPVLKEFLPREATRQPEWATELMSGYWSER